MASIPSTTLNDGTAIPQFGLGVWRVPPEDTAGVVRTAIEAGYRHVDTAQAYGNETGVGQGIREGVRAAGVAREDVWVTTKLAGGTHGAEPARRALEESLRLLGTDYVDLYLIHWPGPDDAETWRAFERMRDDGRVRSVGVSNFSTAQVDRLVAATGVVPAVNQIELNPRRPQRALVEHHRRAGIAVEAHSPLGGGRLLGDRTVREVARRRGCSPAQAVLRWHLQRGFIVFPKSVHEARIRENIDLAGVELTDEDVRALDALGRWAGARRLVRAARRRLRRVREGLRPANR